MTSLMSIFDPSSSIRIIPNSWVVMFVFMPMLKMSFWKESSSFYILVSSMASTLISTFKSNKLLFSSLFLLVLLCNLLGMLPMVFSVTSHLTFNLSIALLMWVGMMVWYMYTGLNNLLAHLTPMGCPMILVPFMIVIEMISNLIRPLTLSLRLMANLMAGHMILFLISSSISVFGASLSSLTMFAVLFIFTMFELGVAFIQAYVYSSLMDLYWEESSNH